jgi:DtxR family Mn-dependent transcriptional regulator
VEQSVSKNRLFVGGTPLRRPKIVSGEKRVHRDTSIGFGAVNKRARPVIGLWGSSGKKLRRAGSFIRRGMVLNCTGATLPGAVMITISKEDYLKAIAESEAEGEAVISATLAHWLAVSRPAVTAALKRLKKDGLVTIKNDGRIQLTSQGRRIAEQTILRHHLVERMLSEIFGMPWYEVHEEAERLEHAVSPAFEKKLVEKLGDNDICPHGNSLALKSPLERRKKGQYLLSEAAEGSHYRVASVYERDRKLLDFFEGEGIRPGARLALQSHNYDGTLSLTVDKRTIRLGAPAAEKVWVVKL